MIIIPILIIVALLSGATLTGGVVIAVYEYLHRKRFAVLGARETGKTALLTYLTQGTLPTTYVQNTHPQKTEPNTLNLDDLKLRVAEGVDLPGSEHYGEWQKNVEKSHIVLYLLRSDMLMAGDAETETRVRRDVGHIGDWLKEYPKEVPLFIIGTHCDLTDPDLTALSDDRIGDYEDKLRRMPIFQEVALLGRDNRHLPTFIFGSLKSRKTTEHLVYQIVEQLIYHRG